MGSLLKEETPPGLVESEPVSDFGLRRMAFVVNKFRSNVLRLQHICVAYNACTSARMELLQLKWEDIESKISVQVADERLAASLLFAGRLRDSAEGRGGSIELDVNKSKLPMLAYKINRTTEQADALQRDMKLTFDKVTNMQVEREAVMQLKPKALRKFLDPKVEDDRGELVPADLRADLMREFLSQRRRLHVKRINAREDKTKKQKDTVDIDDVRRILEGRRDSEEDDASRALEWTTMMVVTGDAGTDFLAVAGAKIREYLKVREVEDKKRMDRIMKKYHLEEESAAKSAGSANSSKDGSPKRPGTASDVGKRPSQQQQQPATDAGGGDSGGAKKENLRTV